MVQSDSLQSVGAVPVVSQQVRESDASQPEMSYHTVPVKTLIGEGMVSVPDTADAVSVPEALRPMAPTVQREMVVEAALQHDFLLDEALAEKTERADSGVVQPWTASLILPSEGREAGEPLAYRVKTDDFVVGALLLCCLFASFFVARSRHFFVIKSKEFFRTHHRENLFNDSSDERMAGKYFFPFVLCCGLSMLFFNYQQRFFPDVLDAFSPYWLMGGNLAVLCTAYGLRTLLYKFVNTVFFERESYVKWIESYHLLTVVASVLMFPLALLVVFDDLDFEIWRPLFYFSAIFVEIFLIFKTYHIFFRGKLGFLHLILYLCTLEFLPLLSLWKGLVWVTQELTKLV